MVYSLDSFAGDGSAVIEESLREKAGRVDGADDEAVEGES